MIANRMRITADAFLGEIFGFMASATRALRTMVRERRHSGWFLLLVIAGGAAVAVVVVKLLALLAAAFGIPLLSVLRDLNNNIPPGGSAPPPPWWGDDPRPLGFLFISANRGDLHQDPSMDSRIVVNDPRGMRVLYDDIRSVNGQDWYRIIGQGRTSGWIPGSDVSSTRPPVLRPARPVTLQELGLMDAHPLPAMTSGSNG